MNYGYNFALIENEVTVIEGYEDDEEIQAFLSLRLIAQALNISPTVKMMMQEDYDGTIYDILEAVSLFARQYGVTELSTELNKLHYNPRASLRSLADLDDGGKEFYTALETVYAVK